MAYFIGHDLGTGGNKTVLVNERGQVFSSHIERYPLHHPAPLRVEQEPEDWWRAVCAGTREVLARANVPASELAGMAFAGQMLTLVPLDRAGAPTRRALSWLDARAGDEARRIVRRLGGERVVELLAGGSPSGKDLVAKVAWLAAHEPETHAKTAAYGDATSFLVARATGELSLDVTAAGATGLLDVQTRRWSRLLSLSD